jgi:hypothetical protein
MDVPTPPFSSTIEESAVRFSESEPHTFEATILTVEKHPTLSVVHLEPTSVPPYSACIGDRIMLRSGLITWEATVIYFGDHQTPPDVTALENRICIHVLDQHGESPCFIYCVLFICLFVFCKKNDIASLCGSASRTKMSASPSLFSICPASPRTSS